MMSHRRCPAYKRQTGLTLIELLVAMGLGLIVTVVAATALLIAQQGYSTVDATTQLRDRERFAVDLLTRVITQAGYQDLGASNMLLRSAASFGPGGDPEPDIYGWNNSVYAIPSGLVVSESTTIVNGNRPSSCPSTANDSSCKNGSDVLVIRYQGVSKTPGSLDADNSMINCAGQSETGLVTGDLNERALSMFHVTRAASGEPSLSCTYYNHGNGTTKWVNTPIIEGVESFQILYGTDGVTPNLAPSATAPQDTVSERWLRADQLTVAGNLVATRENWRRVRAVRVGLVLRAPAGSAQERKATTVQPLGSTYTSPADDGSNLAVAADGRLRLQTAITVQLRNDLTLR
jgi:type IV pilus assembly protein PilW